MEAAHDAGEAGGLLGVGDDQHVGGEGVLFAVEGLHRLALVGPADDDPAAADIPHIIGVHRLAGLQHDEVGDVDDVVDAADPGRAEAFLHPLGRRADPEVFDHPADVPRAEVKVLHLDRDFVMDIAAGGGVMGLGAVEGLAEDDRDLPGDAEDRVAVGAVGEDRKVDDDVVQTEKLPHIGAGLRLAFQQQDAVDFSPGVIPFFQAELFARAHHPVGGEAAELAPLDVGAVREMGVVEGAGDVRTDGDVLGAGDDLHRLFPADIHLADPELVGVGMVLHRDDLAGNDVVHRLTEVFHFLDLKAAHCHLIAEDLGGDVDVHIAF